MSLPVFRTGKSSVEKQPEFSFVKLPNYRVKGRKCINSYFKPFSRYLFIAPDKMVYPHTFFFFSCFSVKTYVVGTQYISTSTRRLK